MLRSITNFLYKKEIRELKKVITVLGIKFKTHDVRGILQRWGGCLNKNTVQVLYKNLRDSSDEDLYCLRAYNLTFVLHKGCLNLDYNFFQDYIVTFGYSGNLLELIKLDKTSFLYREHIDRVNNGEFLWKYTERDFYIAHSFVSKDKVSGKIYIHSSYVKETNLAKNTGKIRHVPQMSKRRYIRGITAGDYIKSRPFEEQVVIADKLLNYIFSTFQAEDDPAKVSGSLLDCHLYNFVIGTDGLFYFVDFDLKCTESLDRNYCIYFMLYGYNRELYRKILEMYGYEDRHKYYEKEFSIFKQPENRSVRRTATSEHRELYQKYFGDCGIIPEYTITYEKRNI